MPLVDYKAKYIDLKTKYHETVDLAWRLGYEQGLKDSQIDQAAQQMAQPQMDPNVPQGAQGVEKPDTSPTEVSEQPPTSQNPQGNELDQHIEKLEGILGKAEITPFELQDLKKTLSDIRSLQVQINLTKSLDSIKATKLTKSQPITFSPKNQANLPEVAKKSLSMQEKIVSDIFSKWGKDESKASSDISSILGIEGISKKD